MLTALSLPTVPDLLTLPNTPFIHRDLSWLQFNERVLGEAQTKTNPLLERVKFLAISCSNLDEFFMIRYPALTRSIQSTHKTNPQAALRLVRIRNDILMSVHQFTLKQAQIFKTLSAELKKAKISLSRLNTHTLSKEPHTEKEIERQIFEQEILPKLPNLEPFKPEKLNLLENFQLAAVFPNNYWMPIPKSLPPIFTHKKPDSDLFYYVFLDQLLMHYLPKSTVTDLEPWLVRLTRDGDFTVDLEEEDPESIPDKVRTSLSSREKGRPVRLQYYGNPTKEFLGNASRSLKIMSSQLIKAPVSLCLQGLSGIQSHLPPAMLTHSKLRYQNVASLVPVPFRSSEDIFSKLDKHDFLLHHPYDSFDAFVVWIESACNDPDVIQIEQTVYRTDILSPMVEALKTAAKTKKVRVVIELRARFDELNNLRLAEELRQSGVEVAFGFGKLKVHGKVALVTRKQGEQLRLYAHLSTGNYHSGTARQYTDLAIMTSHPEICADVRHFFDRVCAGEVPKDFKRLVPAPTKLHRRLLNHIQAETEAAESGKKARIIAKVNALVDGGVIQHLYRASQAGVQVDLIVRGACSLVPGVKGLSENIRVISIVDRFLEHSRIYYFSNAQVIYLSSADWMPRNFFSRLELAFPVLDSQLYRYIEEVILPTYLSDTVKARELTPEGRWRRRRTGSLEFSTALTKLLEGKDKSIRSQFLFDELARREYQDTPLWSRNNADRNY